MSQVIFNCPKLSMRIFGPRNTAYALWHTKTYKPTHIYHAKSRLNTPVWGSLCSPNIGTICTYCTQVHLKNLHSKVFEELLQVYHRNASKDWSLSSINAVHVVIHSFSDVSTQHHQLAFLRKISILLKYIYQGVISEICYFQNL